TRDKGFDVQPAWSPDGKTIAFNSSRGDPNTDSPDQIYLMNSDGKNVRKLVPAAAVLPSYSASATWSPDGSRLVFMAYSPISLPLTLNDKQEFVPDAKDGLYTI